MSLTVPTPEEMEGRSLDDTLLPEALEIFRKIENIPGWREGEVATVGMCFPRPDGWFYALLGQHPVHTRLVRWHAGPSA